jgi:hypothetical protein
MYDPLNLPFLLQMPDGDTRKRATNLEALDKDRLGDELEGWDLLHDAVVGRLVEGNGVLCLILDLALRPLLLLCGLAAG